MFIRPNAEIKHEYAEAELLEMIRDERPLDEDFSVTITRLKGTWIVSGGLVDVPETRTTGVAATFAEAWLSPTTGPVSEVGGR